jgi:hypothetical protein
MSTKSEIGNLKSIRDMPIARGKRSAWLPMISRRNRLKELQTQLHPKDIPKLFPIVWVLILVPLSNIGTKAQNALTVSPLCHFVRWEGGPLELRRRQLLGQVPSNNARLEEAIRQWYNLSTVAYLRAADIDWVSLTWSVGLPVAEEQKNDIVVASYIAECHRAGIQVLAEVSASHLFLDAHESAEMAGLLRDSQGRPVRCDSSLGAAARLAQCYQADLRDRKWKAQVTERALAAIQAGADGILLNNVSGPHYQAQLAASLVREIKEALAKPVESGHTKHDIGRQEQRQSQPLLIPMLSQSSLGQYFEASWLLLEGGVWPGVRARSVSMVDGEIVLAGASQSPWIDSNLWLFRCCRAFSQGRPILLTPQGSWETNADGSPLPKRHLALAVAEAAALGSSFVVTLDDTLRQGLFERNPEMLGEWQSVARYHKFFSSHPELVQMRPLNNVAVVLESCNDSAEMLNLLSRRGLSYDVIRLDEFSKTSLEPYGLLIVNQASRWAEELFDRAKRFANAGGVVIATASNLPAGNALRSFERLEETSQITQYRCGQGRWIVYSNAFPEPDAFAGDVRALLTTSDQRLVRMWNAPGILAHQTQSVDLKRKALHLLNYGIEPWEELQVSVKGSFQKGELVAPDLKSSVPLKLEPKSGATEFIVPKLGIYGLVLLE